MTDSDFLLAVLQSDPDEWVAQHTILERSFAERGCGLTVHSRAATLRERGHIIECDVRLVKGGRRASYYRLRPSLSSAPVSTVPEWAAGIGADESEALARPESAATRWDDTASESEDVSLTLFDTSTRPAWA
jgi:hypothetical protein